MKDRISSKNYFAEDGNSQPLLEEQTWQEPSAATARTTRARLRASKAVLWASADKLRNNMDAAEYKHVVLGLMFQESAHLEAEILANLKGQGYEI